ncbi:MAG: ribonuclease VapC, partial [Pseudonocardiales bacterium]|nr:ribonuclease VapC [Pseudonocardiales bacterium]
MVDPLLSAAVMSAANWSETWQKLHQHGVDADRATRRLRVLGVRVEPLTAADAVTAARLRDRTRNAGLSLGDR